MESMIGNKVAETVEALEMGLVVALGTVGAYGVADTGVLLGCVKQRLVLDGVALGKVFG